MSAMLLMKNYTFRVGQDLEGFIPRHSMAFFGKNVLYEIQLSNMTSSYFICMLILLCSELDLDSRYHLLRVCKSV